MNRSHKNSCRSRGSALIAVIITFVLISAAITALALLFATEARRTRATLAGAQLRQLLLAAAPSATDELNKNGNAAREIPVKTPLPQDTLTLTITPRSPTTAQVTIIAKTPTASLSQSLTYTKTATTWSLHTATLNTQLASN